MTRPTSLNNGKLDDPDYTLATRIVTALFDHRTPDGDAIFRRCDELLPREVRHCCEAEERVAMERARVEWVANLLREARGNG